MNKKGFTLIELLVVVLIIGILSSVALPQYTKAVEKSRVAGVWSTLGSLRKAANVYFLENPEYGQVEDMKSLDAELNYTYSGDWCSARNCSVDCPNKGWSECAYMAHQYSKGNIGVSFYFVKNNEYIELTLDNDGQHCWGGNYCKDIGISANN